MSKSPNLPVSQSSYLNHYMSDKQRHLVIILSVLFIALICGAIVFVARNFFQQEAAVELESRSFFSTEVEEAEGVRVVAVDPTSPAAAAGVPADSILLGVDGYPVDSPQDLIDYMQDYAGDGNVVLTLKEPDVLTTKTLQLVDGETYLGLEIIPRGREEFVLTPTATPETAVPAPTLPPPDATPIISPPVVTSVLTDTVAANAGLQIGDIITGIDDKVVLNNRELIEAIAAHPAGTAVRLTIRRGENTLVVTIALGPHPEDPTRGFLGVGLQEQ